MSYTYIRREEALEHMAARAISEGAKFADLYARFGPVLKSYHRRSLPHTLNRLACGEVFDVQDDECVSAMGEALIAAANDVLPGYGNRVLHECTHDDLLSSKTLEDLRGLILRWQSFALVRGQVRARLAARRVLAELGVGS